MVCSRKGNLCYNGKWTIQTKHYILLKKPQASPLTFWRDTETTHNQRENVEMLLICTCTEENSEEKPWPSQAQRQKSRHCAPYGLSCRNYYWVCNGQNPRMEVRTRRLWAEICLYLDVWLRVHYGIALGLNSLFCKLKFFFLLEGPTKSMAWSQPFRNIK